MGTARPAWLHFETSPFSERSFSWVWWLAAATYGVGDVVTTIAIIYFVPHLTEANPVVRAAITAFGGGGFLALKLLVLYAGIGISLWAGKAEDDPLSFYGPPALLTVVGLWVTAHNLALLL
ncbi:hypothetical protein [Haloarcula nitratireducens]|uniref:DUF5658 domain-containing protein n=1 Tax=Haloarcula nitratireducens TaxID=2487749 RepID=A0AAW4PHZ0_9EURY|nr:hypothetical protein [Halomicroarcula nitratireducens]MBX0297198.1 hypothetical protein [Halomicroarcula nitratireducens]